VILYLADTNILGYLARHSPGPLQQRMLTAMLKQEVAISVITRAETRYRLALLSANDKRRASVSLLLQEYPALPWTADAADRYGEIAAHLQQTGQVIGQMDTLIAAHALAEGLILVTHNTRHFERIPGLTLEDWLV
jgi:tRNA(fMet)-specific endonuclease VapC